MADERRRGRAESADALQEQLRRILTFERQKGFDDRAVIGGLGRFLDQWLRRWPEPERDRARGLAAPLERYAELAPAARKGAVDAALALLAAPAPPPLSSSADRPAAAAPNVKAPTQSLPMPSARNGAEGPRPHRPIDHPRPSGPAASAAVPASPPDPPPRREELPRIPAAPESGEKIPRSAAEGGAIQPRREEGAIEVIATALPPSGIGASLDVSVEALKRVGPSNAAKLEKLGIRTIRDLLYHFPRRHLDYRAAKMIRDLTGEGYETVLATIWEVKTDRRPGGLLIIRAILADESGNGEAVWFRRNDYLTRELAAGRTVVLSGECRFVGGRPQFKDPEWESLNREDTIHTARLVPVYPLSEGLGARFVRTLAKQAVDRYAEQIVDHLPAGLREELHLLGLSQAVAQAHFPDTDDLLRAARRRLAFDELLILQLGVLARRRAWDLGDPAPSLVAGDARVGEFLASLPFSLTAAQAEALDAIQGRLRGTVPMNLLLQGDVGSGKTVVATAAMIQAAASTQQAAMMAPTEILAEQHFQTIQRLLGGLGDTAPRVTLLTGSVKGAERRTCLDAIRAGTVQLVVGTQALVQEGVEFAQLGLIVVDEQHRFGVAQRSTLRQKGYNPHVLVMTATPIPRTLALTLYGDLDLAVIGELPPGRQPIKTRFLQPTDRPKAYTFVRREVQAGHQAFIVYPLVEESERSEARAATAEHERLQREVFSDLRLGLLHGRMKPAEKDDVMRRFQAREFDLLVSTSVVEVGIDVPNATVMLIEGANRFGLAQLHQFRGRVGRGRAQSYCLLISDNPNPLSDERLRVVERTQDGFQLAEEDLKLRGPGEFFGTRQSGLPDLKMAKLTDTVVLEEARHAADRLFRDDPRLQAPEHRSLRQQVSQFWQDQIDLN